MFWWPSRFFRLCEERCVMKFLWNTIFVFLPFISCVLGTLHVAHTSVSRTLHMHIHPRLHNRDHKSSLASTIICVLYFTQCQVDSMAPCALPVSMQSTRSHQKVQRRSSRWKVDLLSEINIDYLSWDAICWVSCSLCAWKSKLILSIKVVVSPLTVPLLIAMLQSSLNSHHIIQPNSSNNKLCYHMKKICNGSSVSLFWYQVCTVGIASQPYLLLCTTSFQMAAPHGKRDQEILVTLSCSNHRVPNKLECALWRLGSFPHSKLQTGLHAHRATDFLNSHRCFFDISVVLTVKHFGAQLHSDIDILNCVWNHLFTITILTRFTCAQPKRIYGIIRKHRLACSLSLQQ